MKPFIPTYTTEHFDLVQGAGMRVDELELVGYNHLKGNFTKKNIRWEVWVDENGIKLQVKAPKSVVMDDQEITNMRGYEVKMEMDHDQNIMTITTPSNRAYFMAHLQEDFFLHFHIR